MKKKKGKKIVLIVLGIFLLALVIALLLQAGWGGSYKDRDGKYAHVTKNTSFQHICNHPLWNGNGQNLYSVWGNTSVGKLTGFMSLKALCHWCGWNADSAVEGTNYLIDCANEGTCEIWNIYSDEQIRQDPHLAAAQAVYYQGDPDKPVAIVAAGGGYTSVASFVEAYPYAEMLNKAGYPVVVLKYRVGEDLIPAEDVKSAITPKISEAAKDMLSLIRICREKGLKLDGYSLWGSSAGGGLITSFAFEFEGASYEELGIPRPAALMLIYTHAKYIDKFEFTKNDPPLFTIVGVGDAYGGDEVMDRVVPKMQAAGMDVVYHKYQKYPHGSGLGKGTDAEGWIDEAISFWESHMSKGNEESK